MTKTTKAEYLPGGAKRQEMLDQVPEYLLKPGADQGTKHHFCLEVLKLTCLLYTSPSPRDGLLSRMPSSA